MSKLCLFIVIFTMGSCASVDVNESGNVIFFIDDSKVTNFEVRDDFYIYYNKSRLWIQEEFNLNTSLVTIGKDKISEGLKSELSKEKGKCDVGIYIDYGDGEKLVCSVVTDYDLYQILSNHK